MRISLSTGWKFDMPFSLKKSFQMASELGFDGVELVINGEYWFHKIDFIKDLSNKFNMPILSVHCPLVMSFLFKSKTWVDKTFEIANVLEAELVVIHSHMLKPFYSKDGLDLLNYLKRKRDNYPNIKITLENFRYSQKNKFDNLEDLAKISEKYNYDLTFDTTHVGFTDYELLSVYNLFRPNMQNIHFSDWKDSHEHLVPGRGILPLVELLKKLKKDEYNGLLTLELLFLPFATYKKAYQSSKDSISFIKSNYE
jgi:sugar phosphate isomerase/epimerase